MHARCPISPVFGHYGHRARPPSCRPSWVDPGDPSLMISRADLCPPHLTWDPRPRVHMGWGGHTRGYVCPPYIKLVKYSIRVETLLTPISHLILNQPAMEADTCGFFKASVESYSDEVCKPSVCFSDRKHQKHVSLFLAVVKKRVLIIGLIYETSSILDI